MNERIFRQTKKKEEEEEEEERCSRHSGFNLNMGTT